MAHEATVRGVGLSLTEDGEGTPVVLLEARGAMVPIFIGADQAQSIEMARRGAPTERPLTHDLLIEMVGAYGGRLERVRIDDLSNATFYAKIDVRLGGDNETRGREFVFDARPSDGIALAVRVGCPVTVSDDVVDQAGQPPESFVFESETEFDTDEGPVFE